MRTQEQDREWLLKMAAAEDEALAGCSSGVLAGSSEELQAAWNAIRPVRVSVPRSVVNQIKHV